MQIYAIIKSGRREYRVFPGKVVKIDRMEAEPGEIIEFDEVSKLVNGDQVANGEPLVKGARVRAEVVKHGQEKGIIVFKMKRRQIFRNKFDRQREFTSLKILEIVSGDAVFGKQESDPRKKKRAQAAARAAEIKEAKAANAPVPKRKVEPVPPPIEPVKPENIAPPKPTVPVAPVKPAPEPIVTPAPRTTVSQEITDKPRKNIETQKSRTVPVLAIIAIVILLALLALFWNRQDTSQSLEAQAPEVETPAEIELRKTGELNQPSAPTAPPK